MERFEAGHARGFAQLRYGGLEAGKNRRRERYSDFALEDWEEIVLSFLGSLVPWFCGSVSRRLLVGLGLLGGFWEGGAAFPGGGLGVGFTGICRASVQARG